MRKKETILKERQGEETIYFDEKELQELIKKVAKLSVIGNIPVNEITTFIKEERNAYKESLIPIPKETEDEKEFRFKVDTYMGVKISEFIEENIGRMYFNENLSSMQLENLKNYQYKIALEVACAGYKIYKQEMEKVYLNDIYKLASIRIPRAMSKSGGKQIYIRDWIKRYWFKIVEAKLEDKSLKNKCDIFLNSYEYQNGIEETILKMVFLIQNCKI